MISICNLQVMFSKLNGYLSAKAAAERNKRLVMVDAQSKHNINLPCKSIPELQFFDNKLKNPECLNDFVRTFYFLHLSV